MRLATASTSLTASSLAGVIAGLGMEDTVAQEVVAFGSSTRRRPKSCSGFHGVNVGIQRHLLFASFSPLAFTLQRMSFRRFFSADAPSRKCGDQVGVVFFQGFGVMFLGIGFLPVLMGVGFGH